MQNSTMPWMHCLVSGRVQGVGFRYFVMDQGRRHGVTGWVRNLPDGQVELEAEGDRADLERLLADVKGGPTLARVEKVAVEWSNHSLRSAAEGGGFYRF